MTPKRLLIVDDHPIYRHGLKDLAQRGGEFLVCGEAGNVRDAIHAVRTQHPDIVMTDIALPGLDGVEFIKKILAEFPQLPILIMTVHEEAEYALRAFRAGARGYLKKKEAVEKTVEALRTVVAGNLYVSEDFRDKIVFKAILGEDTDSAAPMDKLSPREWDVIALIAEEKSTREIAEEMGLSVKTVETHRAHLKEKLGFKCCDDLSSFAKEWLAAGGWHGSKAGA